MNKQLDLSLIDINDFLNIAPAQDAFIQGILQGNYAHAYIVFGEKGLAKHRLCHLLADKILGTQGDSVDKLVVSVEQIKNQGLSTASASMGIAAIRDMLVPFISTMSVFNNKRVVIIEQAELLTLQAQNALLKPIESSSDDVIFFIVTSDISKLIATVKSRCIKVQLHRWQSERIINVLSRYNINSETSKKIASRSAGLIAKALDFANNFEETDTLDIAIKRILELKNYKDAISIACDYAKLENYMQNDILDAFEQTVQEALHIACNMKGDSHIIYPSNWQKAIENRSIVSFNNMIKACIYARRMKNMQTNWQSVLDYLLASILEETAKWRLV